MFSQADVHPSWAPFFNSQCQQPYFLGLQAFLQAQTACIYPPKPLILNAFKITPLQEVKVVILGQDPYHGPHQAHGLSFSVPEGQALPPSLINIFKALHFNLNITPPMQGDLTPWAKQGVLLLNTTLTVPAHTPNGHATIGWTPFTQAALEYLSHTQPHVVFMLWGASAQKKARSLNAAQHLILTAPHPSPLSAYRGFIQCRHFSLANAWLRQKGLAPIQWG